MFLAGSSLATNSNLGENSRKQSGKLVQNLIFQLGCTQGKLKKYTSSSGITVVSDLIAQQ